MALRRVLGLNYSIILNSRLICSKFHQTPLFYEDVFPRLGSAVATSFSTKPCYDNDGVVTFPCLKKLLDESDIQLFDVRTREEIEAGRIPGATNIPRKFFRTLLSLHDLTSCLDVISRATLFTLDNKIKTISFSQ